MTERRCALYRIYLRSNPSKGYIGVSVVPERRWFDHLRASKRSLLGNTRAKGKKFSQEHKDRIAAALKGKKHPPQRVKTMSDALMGRKCPQVSKARRGKPAPHVSRMLVQRRVHIQRWLDDGGAL